MSDWFGISALRRSQALVMGAYPQDADDVAALAGAGITRVFNLVQDVEYDPGARDACMAALGPPTSRSCASSSSTTAA